MGIGKIKPVILDYLKNVSDAVRIDRAVLYGSFAKGKATKDSDVDLLIVSPDFSKMDDDDRLKILYRKSVGFPYDLHVYGITPKEYENASSLTTLGNAIKSGIVIS